MISIRKYLQEIRQELKAYEESLTEKELHDFVEKCKKLFDHGEGNYSERHLSEFYILRYALAYGFQFSRMYSAILSDMNEPKQINVTSIGCGTNIDYWGLTYAIEMLNNITCDVDYTGIDPVEWPHRITDQGELYRQNDKIRNNIVNNGVFSGKNICDFQQFLNLGAELGKNKQLSDVYIFPHSIKEVCVHSVPKGELGQYETYNTYQSMAQFAEQVAESLQDRTVYIAFSYRKRPSITDEEVLNDKSENKYEVYDMRYGTYLVSCLRSCGLEVELLEPAKETLKGSTATFKTIEEEKSYSRDFFDYPQCKYYTGNPKDSQKRKMSDYGKDGKYTFSSIFLSNKEDYTIVEKEEWEKTYPGIWPIKYTDDMCFQVFRVRKSPVAVNECYASVRSKYQMRINYQAKQLQNELKEFAIKHNDNQTINLYLKMIKEFIEGKGEQKLADYIPTYNFIRNWLIKEGYVEKRTYEEMNRTEPTEYGLKTGMFIEDFVAEDGTSQHNMMISPFFCETLLANIISGKYLNYQLFLQNSITQEQVEHFPYQEEMFVGKNKFEKTGISHFVDVVTKMGLSSDYAITKIDFSHMLVRSGVFEYDKVTKEYHVSESGQKLGFSVRKINNRLYFVANEEAQRFLVSLLAPKEVI